MTDVTQTGVATEATEPPLMPETAQAQTAQTSPALETADIADTAQIPDTAETASDAEATGTTGASAAGGMPATDGTAPTSGVSVDEMTEAMRDVVDPELGINVVDLGLVYGLRLDGRVATIDMTLTSAACPLTDVIEEQTRAAIGPLVDSFAINWVWMPPWGPDKITDEGREQLRALGFNV